jgi:protein SCO1/2
MISRLGAWWGTLLPLMLVSGLTVAVALSCAAPSKLPKIGQAAPFALTAQDESRLSLSDLGGTVALVTFIYTSCTDTCPLVTAKLAQVQQGLGADFGPKVRFVSITVDPEHDTPAVLDAYARRFGADPRGWVFLTGAPADIAETSSAYGVFARRTPRGDVDHTFLTSLIDRRGALRVQYVGYRFDPDELLADLRSLVREW